MSSALCALDFVDDDVVRVAGEDQGFQAVRGRQQCMDKLLMTKAGDAILRRSSQRNQSALLAQRGFDRYYRGASLPFRSISMRGSCPPVTSPVLLGLALVLLAATPARAQSPYVGATALADVVRSSGSEDSDVGNGEAIGGALRVGAALGPRWGVELEFARSGEIEWRPDVTILATATRGRPELFGALPDIAIFPAPQISVESQLSTLTTSVWWRQRVNDRFDLVYLGGVTFARSQIESEVNYTSPLVGRPGQQVPTRLYTQEFTDYDTGVTVGLDAAIGMTEHLWLVPGVRMLALDSQWIIRPAVGLQWRF